MSEVSVTAFLGETHTVDCDGKFWKAQCYFCHSCKQAAGVAVLLNKFKGDVVESLMSEDNFSFQIRQFLLYSLQHVWTSVVAVVLGQDDGCMENVCKGVAKYKK